MRGPILGIETSCDETAVALCHDGIVLTNRVASQVPLHARFGGVVPEIAARNHLLTILPTLQLALADTGLHLRDLGGIAVTNRPGLVGALLVGVQTARTLALVHDLPLVGVDHVRAHVWAVMLRPPGQTEKHWLRPELPHLALAVSGGHTSLTRVEGPGVATLIGRTLDDAAGEAFDKVAKMLGLPYPGGPSLERAARGGNSLRFDLPAGMRGRDDFAFSFSGLKTATRLLIESLRAGAGAGAGAGVGTGTGAVFPAGDLADVCASFQRAVVQQLVRVTLRAAQAHGLADVVLAGGVAANRALRQEFSDACTEAGLRFWPVPPAYCTDNAAMVAGLGEALLDAGHRDDPHTLDAMPTGSAHRASQGRP